MEVRDECFGISGIRDSRVWSARVLCIWDPRYPDVRWAPFLGASPYRLKYDPHDLSSALSGNRASAYRDSCCHVHGNFTSPIPDSARSTATCLLWRTALILSAFLWARFSRCSWHFASREIIRLPFVCWSHDGRNAEMASPCDMRPWIGRLIIILLIERTPLLLNVGWIYNPEIPMTVDLLRGWITAANIKTLSTRLTHYLEKQNRNSPSCAWAFVRLAGPKASRTHD